MRDLETAEIALEAAETGHLVLSTLHTIDASKTIDRIIGLYPKNEERIIRTRLAQTFRYIVSQRLIPKIDGKRTHRSGRDPASNPRTREYIEKGESEGKTLLDAIRDGEIDGMQDFDSVIRKMIETKTISLEDGLSYATNQNNLLLQLKGLSSTEDYANPQKPFADTFAACTAAANTRRQHDIGAGYDGIERLPSAGSQLSEIVLETIDRRLKTDH